MQGSSITILRQWHTNIQGGNNGSHNIMAPSYLCSKYQYTLKFKNKKRHKYSVSLSEAKEQFSNVYFCIYVMFKTSHYFLKKKFCLDEERETGAGW